MRLNKIFLAAIGLLFASLLSTTAAACPRIVSQSPYITHQLAWLGLQDCIVGASRYESTIKAPDTGGVLDPDSSAIAALKPDFVITSTWTTPEKLAAITPPGARGVRLASFQSMDQITQNLRELGKLARLPDADTRATAFDRLWRKKAAAIHGDDRRVLLLSSCTGTAYSFGQNTWLAQLFSEAGFVVADPSSGVRHLPPATTAEATTQLIKELRPEIVFVFTRQIASTCGMVPLPPGTPLVALDGDKFLHPAPILLEGLDALQAARSQWAH